MPKIYRTYVRIARTLPGPVDETATVDTQTVSRQNLCDRLRSAGRIDVRATAHSKGFCMAKHRRMSGRSRRARTVIGGLAAGGALAAFVPAGMAAAATDVNKDKDDVQVNADTPGAAVGRPD